MDVLLKPGALYGIGEPLPPGSYAGGCDLADPPAADPDEAALVFAELPLLFADGEHDDLPAIRAAGRGNPVRCARCLKVVPRGPGYYWLACGCWTAGAAQ